MWQILSRGTRMQHMKGKTVHVSNLVPVVQNKWYLSLTKQWIFKHVLHNNTAILLKNLKILLTKIKCQVILIWAFRKMNRNSFRGESSTISFFACLSQHIVENGKFFPLTQLHSEQPKLYGVLAVLNAKGSRVNPNFVKSFDVLGSN